MNQYLELLDDIMADGFTRQGRNGNTRALFGPQLRFNLKDGFPAVTTKPLKFDSVLGELLWFLRGSDNDNDLRALMGYEPGRPTIWTANAMDPNWTSKPCCISKPPGYLGRIYGVQWTNFDGTPERGNGTDQISELLRGLVLDPFGRRHIVSAWNPNQLGEMALPPCHIMFQCLVAPPNKLTLIMYQRSADTVLGVPFNIASYALLAHLIAAVTGLEADTLVINLGDAHIYEQHFPAVAEQLRRAPMPLPTLVIDPKHVRDRDSLMALAKAGGNLRFLLGQIEMGDVSLNGYQSHPKLVNPTPMIV